jgi:hypothetical protein
MCLNNYEIQDYNAVQKGSGGKDVWDHWQKEYGNGKLRAFQQIRTGIRFTMRHLLYFFISAFCVNLAGGEPVSILVETSGSGITSFNNPLKGIKEFTVFLPGRSDEPETKFVIRELEKIGFVKIFSMSKAPIDYEGMGTGMCLMLSIHELDVLDKPDSTMKRIFLTLGTDVEVIKTKHPYRAHIWETNVFVMKDNVMDGVKKILKPFVYLYKEANPNEKPIFYIYL